MTQLLPNIFAVEVPDKSSFFELNNECELFLLPHPGHSVRKNWITLPPGSYEILFATKKCKEDQAQNVVGKEGVHPSWPHNPLYTNYSNSRLYIDDARESLQSLLRSKNLDPNKNYLLLKRIDL